ncbi:NAD(P)-dependent oxidoreductase [Microbacterium maritypicum]|uniref:NAD(P)-dependent oxidoreductase n=1 Tax=Microbacterium maritypicum TaxID=33918 RepID=UPI0019A5AC01|nr:NAD(P)-binding domain-containing protein [Microbacterium liquefaciens]GGV59185.1 3-hydroxyisobutyrate dehydrogenase [Microbacterium liquefaciens]
MVGVGRMGEPIARTLTGAHSAQVFDTDPARHTAAPDLAWADTVQELAFVTVLPGPVELRQVMVEALPLLPPGALWLDLTSGDPAVTRDLAAHAAQHDVAVVSAPMGGSVDEAAKNMLVFFVSGEEVAVARALPILNTLARDDGIRRAGTRAEDGQIVKLLANGLWFAHSVAAAEALLIGQGLGISTTHLHHLLRDSAGGSRFLDDHAGRLLQGDYLSTFGVDRVVDELDTITTMARTAQVPTPVLDASSSLHHAALDLYGPELGELLAVKLLEQRTGRRLRAD